MKKKKINRPISPRKWRNARDLRDLPDPGSLRDVRVDHPSRRGLVRCQREGCSRGYLPLSSFLVPRPRRGACCYGTPSDISLAVCFSRCWRGIYFIVTHISFFSVRKIFRPAYYAFQPFSSFFKWSRFFFSGNQIYKFYGSSYSLINWIQTDQHSTQFDANDRRQCWRGWWTSWGGRRVSRAWNDRVATLRPSSAETTERDQLHRYHGFIIRQLNQFPFESFRWFNSIWTKS